MASVFERGKEKFHHVLSNTRVCCFKQQCNDSRVSFSLVVWHQNNIVTLQSIIRVTYYIPKKPLLHQEIFEDQIPASIKNTLKISTYNRPLNTQIILYDVLYLHPSLEQALINRTVKNILGLVESLETASNSIQHTRDTSGHSYHPNLTQLMHKSNWDRWHQC